MIFRLPPETPLVRLPILAMSGVLFLLCFMFGLTLKTPQSEPEFLLHSPQSFPVIHQYLKLKLEANRDGSLKQIYFGEVPLGADDEAFDALTIKIAGWYGLQSSSHFQSPNPFILASYGNALETPHMLHDVEPEIVIRADYNLQYRYLTRAISACRNHVDADGKHVTLIEKIRFSPLPGDEQFVEFPGAFALTTEL